MQTTGKFPNVVHDVIEQVIRDVQFGSLILVVQDAKVVQIERTERIVLTAKAPKVAGIKRSAEQARNIGAKILSELAGLQYGQLLIKMQDGKIVQLEKTEKRRYTGVEGVHGDGI